LRNLTLRNSLLIHMKDTKRKPLIKAAKKEVRKNIQTKLAVELKNIAVGMGSVSAKLEKLIAKEANKLAKKLAKKIQLDEVAIAANAKPVKVKNAASAQAAKPAKVAPEKSTNKSTKAEPVVTAS
jgi:hypothetical protein